MQLKLDDQGHVVLNEGKPVYVDDAGKDQTLDPVHLLGRVRTLTSESAGYRAKAEEYEGKFAPFKDMDPEKVKTDLQKLADIDTKKLMDAGQVEAIRNQIREAAKQEYEAAQRASQQALAEKDATIADLTGHLNKEKIGGNFTRSEWVKKNVNVPLDMFQNTFEGNFKVEDGQLWGYLNGNKIYDPTDFSSPAKFDVCIEKMVDSYPFKDQILVGTGSSGSNATGNDKPGSAVKGNLGGTRDERVAAIRASLPPELRGSGAKA